MSDHTIENVIMDFDGVIADSFDIFVNTLTEVLERKPLAADEIEDLRNNPSVQEVIKSLGVKKLQIPKLMIKGRRIITAKMSEVEIFSGMDKFISQVSETKKVYILSTNSEENITEFLTRYKINDCITDIYSGTALLGKSKRLNQLLKKESLELNQSVYIGDETRDIESAREIGMNNVAVTWGYNTASALKSCSPTAIASSPAKLKQIIQRL